MTHRSCCNEWLSTEWLLNGSNRIGPEGQCVIYSYAFWRYIRTDKDRSRKMMDANYIAIGLIPKEKWPGSMFKAGELALVQNPRKRNNVPPLFSGRMLDPNRINIEMVKRWLHMCTERYSNECRV
jgi:hypothetical protein